MFASKSLIFKQNFCNTVLDMVTHGNLALRHDIGWIYISKCDRSVSEKRRMDENQIHRQSGKRLHWIYVLL
jgi:hypothetical protein